MGAYAQQEEEFNIIYAADIAQQEDFWNQGSNLCQMASQATPLDNIKKLCLAKAATFAALEHQISQVRTTGGCLLTGHRRNVSPSNHVYNSCGELH